MPEILTPVPAYTCCLESFSPLLEKSSSSSTLLSYLGQQSANAANASESDCVELITPPILLLMPCHPLKESESMPSLWLTKAVWNAVLPIFSFSYKATAVSSKLTIWDQTASLLNSAFQDLSISWLLPPLLPSICNPCLLCRCFRELSQCHGANTLGTVTHPIKLLTFWRTIPLAAPSFPCALRKMGR